MFNDTNATLTVVNSTVSGNFAYLGGGIFNSGTLTVVNSTLSGNMTLIYSGFGGGIYDEGAVTLTYCTMSGNSASDGGGILIVSPPGRGS